MYSTLNLKTVIYYFKAKIFYMIVYDPALRLKFKNCNSYQILIFNNYVNNELMTMINN